MLARVRARQEGKDLIISPEDIRHLSQEDRMRFVLDEVKKAGILPKDIGDEIGVPYVRSYLTGYKTRQSAIFNYRPQVYPGKITLLRCVEEDQQTLAALKKFGGDTSDPAFGWGALSAEAVDVHMVPGNHDQVLQEPNVEALARSIRMRAEGTAREARGCAI
jgi:thioesterase domain-containing protein